MNILITGGLGFIGSNLFNFMKEKYPDYNLVILDSETYAAKQKNIKNESFAKVIKFSITDRKRLFNLFENFKFSHVIHLAAESHVDADHRAGQPGVPRQAQRHDRGLRQRVRLAGKSIGHLRRGQRRQRARRV